MHIAPDIYPIEDHVPHQPLLFQPNEGEEEEEKKEGEGEELPNPLTQLITAFNRGSSAPQEKLGADFLYISYAEIMSNVSTQKSVTIKCWNDTRIPIISICVKE